LYEHVKFEFNNISLYKKNDSERRWFMTLLSILSYFIIHNKMFEYIFAKIIVLEKIIVCAEYINIHMTCMSSPRIIFLNYKKLTK